MFLGCSFEPRRNREENLLCHVAMVAKFLVDLHSFKLRRSYSISFNFSNVGEIFWVESERPYLGLEKEKENVCVVLIYLIKRASEIRKVYVAVVQQRLKNVQKSVMHVHVHVLLQKLSIVVIQKICYHGNVTSHLSSL